MRYRGNAYLNGNPMFADFTADNHEDLEEMVEDIKTNAESVLKADTPDFACVMRIWDEMYDVELPQIGCYWTKEGWEWYYVSAKDFIDKDEADLKVN